MLRLLVSFVAVPLSLERERAHLEREKLIVWEEGDGGGAKEAGKPEGEELMAGGDAHLSTLPCAGRVGTEENSIGKCC